VFIPAVFAVVWRGSTDASLVGLSISYALHFTDILSWLIKITSYLQYNFVSVERIAEYSSIGQVHLNYIMLSCCRLLKSENNMIEIQ